MCWCLILFSCSFVFTLLFLCWVYSHDHKICVTLTTLEHTMTHCVGKMLIYSTYRTVCDGVKCDHNACCFVRTPVKQPRFKERQNTFSILAALKCTFWCCGCRKYDVKTHHQMEEKNKHHPSGKLLNWKSRTTEWWMQVKVLKPFSC